jgi:FdhD protein
MKPQPRRKRTATGRADRTAAAMVVLRCRPGKPPESAGDVLAREEPLEIRLRGRGVAVTMRTPGQDAELAAGFLLSEGVIRRREDLVEVAAHGPVTEAGKHNLLNVFLAPNVDVDYAHLTRHVFASSSCGLCGKASIEAVHQHFPPLECTFRLSADVLRSLPAAFLEAQKTFQLTGGLHAAAIFDEHGKLVVLREDVGRHNAVDKVIGYGLLEAGFPFERHVLMVSGRASFEIMQKALAARVPVVAAISAPSSLAVAFARDSGQALAGFLRGETFNLYAHPERILGAH